MATAALIPGILALLTSITVIGGIVLGLIAVVLGFLALRKASRGEADDRGRAVAGIVTGALGIIIAVILVAVGASLPNSHSGRNLQSWLKNANANQSAVQQCQQQSRTTSASRPQRPELSSRSRGSASADSRTSQVRRSSAPSGRLM